MVSFGARQALRVIAATVKSTLSLTALTAFVVPCAAALDAAAFDDQQQQILAKIEEIEARDGPYSPALLEELTRLIVLYRENEINALALVAIERALQVVRANSGLYSLEQVPLLWQRIESEEALRQRRRGLGSRAGAVDAGQATPRRPASRARPARDGRSPDGRPWARVDGNETPPQVILGCYYKEWLAAGDGAGNCHSGTRKTVVQGMLADADRNYADAIAVLLRNEAYSSDELRELEMELVRGAELIYAEYARDGNRSVTGSRTKDEVPVPLVPWSSAAEDQGAVAQPNGSDRRVGRLGLALRRARERPRKNFCNNASRGTPASGIPTIAGGKACVGCIGMASRARARRLAQATAIVQIADWDLLFSHNGLAIEGYTLAQDMLERAGADEAARRAALRAGRARRAAVVRAEPARARRDASGDGPHRRGVRDHEVRPRREIEIRGAANATDDARRRPRQSLEEQSVPAAADGRRFADAPPVVVRTTTLIRLSRFARLSRPRPRPRTIPSGTRVVPQRSFNRGRQWRRRRGRRQASRQEDRLRKRLRSERAASRSSSSRSRCWTTTSIRITSGSGRSKRRATRRSTSRSASISAGCTTTASRACAKRSRAPVSARCCRSISTTSATRRARSSASGRATSCCAIR